MLLAVLLACGADPLTLLSRDDPWPAGCDVLAQDCGEGERCALDHSGFAVPVWYAASDRAAPTGPAECLPITGSVGLDAPCTVDLQTGLDDCDAGLSCFTTDADRSEGVCAALCQPGAGDCSAQGLPDRVCRTSHIDAPGYCLTDCQLSEEGCPEGTTCSYYYAYPVDRDSTCLPTGPADLGETCGDVCCGEGLTCFADRCTEVCAVDDPDSCDSGHCMALSDGDGMGICWLEEE